MLAINKPFCFAKAFTKLSFPSWFIDKCKKKHIHIPARLAFNPYAHPHFSSDCKNRTIEYRESIGYDVTNCNIASFRCLNFTPMTYGHERNKIS